MKAVVNKIFNDENKKFFVTLFTLAIPIILQNLLNSLVNLVDSFMIGKLGVNAINAVGFANELFFLYTLLIFGIGSGSAIFMAQFWGKNDVPSIHKAMGICFAVSMAGSILFALLAFFAPERFLGLYSSEPEVIREGTIYLKIIAGTYILTAISSTYNFALRCVGETKIPMIITFAALMTNVIFNYIFIFIFKWGVAGAAIATAIARIAETVVQLLLIYRLKLPVAARIKAYFKIDKKFVKVFFVTTIPVVLNELVWAVGTSLYNVAYKGAGNEAQGALRIANAVQNIFIVIGIGAGAACGILIANMLGARETKAAVKYSRKSMILSIVISVVMGILLFASAPLILRVYEVPETVKQEAFRIMCVIAVVILFKTFNYVTIVGILRNGGDTKYCLKLDAMGVWFIGVPLAFLGTYIFHLPMYVVVALVSCEELFKFFLSARRVLSNVWVKTLV